MTTVHEMAPQHFGPLASGAGGAAAVEFLRETRYSKHLLLIGHLLSCWPGPSAERERLTAVLESARRASPRRFRRVVGGPSVGAWAAIAGRAQRQGAADRADFDHLAGITLAVCAACGVDATAEVPVRAGVAVLPGLGAIPDPGLSVRLAVVSGRPVRESRGPGGEPDGWLPMRYLEADGITVALDDLDPYRHGYHAPPLPRLTDEDADRWRGSFVTAWGLLRRYLPERAAELTAGLSVLIPLRSDPRSALSATLRHSFGAVGLTRPLSPAEFVVTLIHEFQHSKLSAVLDLDIYTDPQDTRRYFAPWRSDPRPLPGLLQGVYAFVGVADAWRALRASDVGPDDAEVEFAYARGQVDAGLSSLEGSSGLTRRGREFVAGLRRVVDDLLAEPVPHAAGRAAAQRLRALRQGWARRNGVPV